MPWAVGGSGFYESVIQAIADRYEIPTDVPWRELTREQQDYFLYGTGGDYFVFKAQGPSGSTWLDISSGTDPRSLEVVYTAPGDTRPEWADPGSLGLGS